MNEAVFGSVEFVPPGVSGLRSSGHETRPRVAGGRGMVINKEGNGKQRNEMGLRPSVILLLLISFQRCQNCNYVFIVNLAAH